MAWIRRGGIAYVTSLPSAPVDGQEVYYAADATNGVIWHLRYRSASSSSYKWEFVGGADLLTVSNSGTASFTNSWTALAGSVTVPLAGDYNVEFGCMAYGDSATGRDANVQVATSTPSGASDPLRLYVTNTVHDISARQSKLSGLSASATIQLWGKNDSSAATTLTEHRWLAVTPVRVG